MNGSGERQLVTILIPQYRTPELTRLCLRSIRKYTDMDKVRVVVIDTHSNDASLDYLRSLSWITLIERKPVAGESPANAHAGALDLGLAVTQTPYVLSIHSDTIVARRGWLELLIDRLETGDDIAGVGSWKLEQKPPLRALAKKLERAWQRRVWYPLFGREEGELEGLGKNYYYLRSHCAMYRTELLRRYTNGFYDGDEVAGKVLHGKLEEQGFKLMFIPSDELVPYMRHLNHATMILNPEIAGRGTGSRKEYRRIMKELQSLNYRQLLQDDALDSDLA
jgi:glycosyltransferase involved in cell wall biosynthesis